MAAVAAGAGEAGRGGSPLRALVVLVLLQGLFVQAFVGLTPRGPSAQHRRVPPRTWAAPADGDEPEGTAAPESAAPEPPAPAPTIPRPLPEPEHVTLWEYFFGKEGEFEEDLRSVGISRQRLLLNTGLATALALGANFVGTTSALLGVLPPETVDDLKLDVLYPIRGFKRFVDKEDGYEFRYPKEWLEDQAVLLAETRERAAAAATMSGVDPLSSSRPIRIPGGRPRRPGQGVRPDAALGPPGGDAEENVSVVKSRVAPGFSLEGTLGAPQQAAETLLATAIAPPGSGKNATLIGARAEFRAPGGLVYEFEYIVKRESGPQQFALHSLSVIAARPEEDALFTLTVLAPESRWREREGQLRQVADSFRLIR